MFFHHSFHDFTKFLHFFFADFRVLLVCMQPNPKTFTDITIISKRIKGKKNHTIFISRRHQSGKRCMPCSPFWMLNVVTSSVWRPHRQPRIAFKTLLCHRALGIRCYSIIKCISKVLLLLLL